MLHILLLFQIEGFDLDAPTQVFLACALQIVSVMLQEGSADDLFILHRHELLFACRAELVLGHRRFVGVVEDSKCLGFEKGFVRVGWLLRLVRVISPLVEVLSVSWR